MAKRKLNKLFHIRDIHFNQCGSAKRRNIAPPNYTIEELQQWCLAQPQYHKLHEDWVNSGFQRNMAPSIDRKDDYKGYTLDNIQLMTAKENLDKAFTDCASGKNTKRSLGVDQFTLTGEFIKRFPSMNLAGRALNAVNGSMISAVCNGKRNSAHGFSWKLAEEELVDG